MPEAVAIRHVAFEDLGLLEPMLRARGFEIIYVDPWDLDRRRIERAELVIFLGGPISVNDTGDYPFLSDEIDLVRARIAADAPTLGICLGAQIMTRALGGSVFTGPEKEIGWASVTLTEVGQTSILAPLEGIPVLHWHGEVCEPPDGIGSLAFTAACANQAFVPSPRTLALQFHIEAGTTGIEPWLIGHTAEIAATPRISVSNLRADTARYGAALRNAASAVFENWFCVTWDNV